MTRLYGGTRFGVNDHSFGVLFLSEIDVMQI